MQRKPKLLGEAQRIASQRIAYDVQNVQQVFNGRYKGAALTGTDAQMVAALSPACGVHNVATRALDAAGIAWSEVFLGGGSFAVMAAVSAGLAIAPFSRRVAPPGTVDVGERQGLPVLAPSEIVLHSTLSDARSRVALRTLAAAFREHRPA